MTPVLTADGVQSGEIPTHDHGLRRLIAKRRSPNVFVATSKWHKPHFTAVWRGALINSLVALALVPLPGLSQHQLHQEVTVVETRIEIPASIQVEHEEIHSELVAATKAAGRVGEAARALAAVLHPHFVREEEIALPPLGLLAALARGEPVTEMQGVLAMTDSLRAELPRMLEEHKAIHAATKQLGDAARAEKSVAVAHLAEKLALHAQSEEEVFYPAAILVGELVRARAR